MLMCVHNRRVYDLISALLAKMHKQISVDNAGPCICYTRLARCCGTAQSMFGFC